MRKIVLLLVTLAAVVTVAPASAQTEVEPLSTEAIMAIGTVMDGERIVAYGNDGYVTENVDIGTDAKSTATVYCGWRRARVTYRSFIWTVQWWYQQKQSRCYNSSTRSSAKSMAGNETGRFQEHRGSS